MLRWREMCVETYERSQHFRGRRFAEEGTHTTERQLEGKERRMPHCKNARAYKRHALPAIMVLFTCTALRFKQPTTISFASLTSLSREKKTKKLTREKSDSKRTRLGAQYDSFCARGFSSFERAKRASRDFSLVVSFRGRARGVGILPFAPPALLAPVETRELRGIFEL